MGSYHRRCCSCPGLYEGSGMLPHLNHCPSRQAGGENIGQQDCLSHHGRGQSGSRGQKGSLQTTLVVSPLLAVYLVMAVLGHPSCDRNLQTGLGESYH